MPKIQNWSRDRGRKGRDGFNISSDEIAWSHDENPDWRASVMKASPGSNEPAVWWFALHKNGNNRIFKKIGTKSDARDFAVKWMRNHPNGYNSEGRFVKFNRI